ncbi:MAG TPA: S9 family peptidase, partial [Caulobacteraceae bacterium]|nr:S9 family peptidase [Caulobacteraceae bacterium]
MKTLLLIGAAALIAALAPLAHADQPPLVDRQAFFGEIQISGAQISPDGKWLSFLKPYKGVRNIWIKTVDEPFSAAKPISADAQRPIRSYFWSRDSKYVLYSQDHGGDENFNIYAIEPGAAPDPATGLPPTRALTNMQKVRVEIYAAPKSKPDILYIGLNDR